MISLFKGVTAVDSSVAGLGGCPYAPGASGNVPTEDVLYMLELLNMHHGVDIDGVVLTGDFISKAINVENRASVGIEDFMRLEEAKNYVWGK